jgi:aryl-alcohol dehydrogenase-like predicted oxidoreductase
MPLPSVVLGGLTVSRIGLGCMPFSFGSGPRDQSIATVHAALDAGITLLDTANIYAPTWDSVGHNESVIAEALRTYTGAADLSAVMIATKGGITRGPGESWGRDGSRDGLRRACEASLTALGVASIDLYQLHRHDPTRSDVEQVEALAALRDAGLVRTIGLSNCTLAELDVALETVGGPLEGGIASVQNEFSPRFRTDADVLDRCAERGIIFLPWSPLGGSEQARDVGSLYTAFAAVAEEVGATAQEVTLAWLMSLAPVVVPIPGASRPMTVHSIVRSLDVRLTPEQRDLLDATVPLNESLYPDEGPRSPLR